MAFRVIPWSESQAMEPERRDIKDSFSEPDVKKILVRAFELLTPAQSPHNRLSE